MSAGAVRVAVRDVEPDALPCAPLVRLLDDLAAVVGPLSPENYTARPLPTVSGSVGEHVRHVLDHVSAFAASPADGVVSYDHRERGTRVEVDPGAAVRAIMRLAATLEGISDAQLDATMVVSTLVERGGYPLLARSTRRRELAFVISHTVHHQAIVALLLAVSGRRTPHRFGLAPSTPQRH